MAFAEERLKAPTRPVCLSLMVIQRKATAAAQMRTSTNRCVLGCDMTKVSTRLEQSTANDHRTWRESTGIPSSRLSVITIELANPTQFASMNK